MEELNSLLEFFKQYGLVLTIIAIVGIILLGILKYCKVFEKVDEKYRHLIYLAISVGFSIIASIIYLAIVGQFTIGYITAIASAIYILDQAFYGLFKSLSLNELISNALDYIKGLIIKKDENTETEEVTEDTVEEVEDKTTEETK